MEQKPGFIVHQQFNCDSNQTKVGYQTKWPVSQENSPAWKTPSFHQGCILFVLPARDPNNGIELGGKQGRKRRSAEIGYKRGTAEKESTWQKHIFTQLLWLHYSYSFILLKMAKTWLFLSKIGWCGWDLQISAIHILLF